MRDTWQIGRACSIGGALCALVALLAAPAFWWLGILAGLAGGYISHEFREILRAIPIAFQAARTGGRDTASGLVFLAQQLRLAVRWFFAQSHPIFYPAVVLGTLLWLPVLSIFLPWLATNPGSSTLANIFLGAESFVLLMMVSVMLLIGFAFLGSRFVEGCFWYPFLSSPPSFREGFLARGYTEASITYRNFLRWVAKGFGLVLLFLVWTWWTQTLRFVLWVVPRFLCVFAWQLFTLIHSHKRVLCALDGTLGGVAAYLLLAHPGMGLAQQAVLVAFGGFLGAALGVLNWELVSKRWLKVAPMST